MLCSNLLHSDKGQVVETYQMCPHMASHLQAQKNKATNVYILEVLSGAYPTKRKAIWLKAVLLSFHVSDKENAAISTALMLWRAESSISHVLGVLSGKLPPT
jgi:hypothetical protein